MRSIIVKNNYGLDHIELVEDSKPSLAINEVLVRVDSISLNQLDLMVAKGAFSTKLPHVLGSDSAGKVAAVGDGVTSLKVGDWVTTHFIQDWQSGALESQYLKSKLGTNTPGVFSEYIALPETSFVKVPSHLTMNESSTLPIAGLTAWEALQNIGQLVKGQTVLLQGTGGVSIFALQFAKSIGARVVILSGSDAKLAKAKALGADAGINYISNQNWQEEVLRLTDGDGVDLALEMSWTEISKTVDCLKINGKIVVVGLLGGIETKLSVFGVLQKNVSISGLQVGSKASFEAMNKFITQHQIKPIVDRVFAVENFREAIEYFEAGKHFGKVVLTF